MFFLKSKEPVSPEEVEREKQRKSEEFERRKQDLLRRLASLQDKVENGTITEDQLDRAMRDFDEVMIYGKTKKQMRMEGLTLVLATYTVIEVVVCCFFFVLWCALARILKDPDHNMARTIAHWKQSISESIEVAIAYYPVKLVEQAGLFVTQHQSA